MNRGMSLFGGMAMGAGLVYMLDPRLGRRRRALLRDKIVSAKHQMSDALEISVRDARHRAQGMVAKTTSLLKSHDADDEIIQQRVRSKMGRYVSHPRAIGVTVQNGQVTLSGPVLSHEVQNLLSVVGSVPGVHGVQNNLDVHEHPENISSLQGGVPRAGERMNLREVSWAPGTRLLTGAAGGALLTYSMTQRFPISCILGTAGICLIARAGTNKQMKHLLGLATEPGAIEVQKTITIVAPRTEVFQFWTHYDNFPRFMSHVKEVRDLGDGRSHWVAIGPGGVPVSWNATITQLVPNEVLAWHSEPDSAIRNAGRIRFESPENGLTRIDVHLTYTPPAGALGHLAAKMFGADPKSAMDDDLMRLKTLLERGKTSAPGKEATLADLDPDETSTPPTPAPNHPDS